MDPYSLFVYKICITVYIVDFRNSATIYIDIESCCYLCPSLFSKIILRNISMASFITFHSTTNILRSIITAPTQYTLMLGYEDDYIQ